MPSYLDDAAKAVDDLVTRLGKAAPAGYLTYNPGPGIYSRLERAVEAMPANVRVQELPGLLKRHKEGVPGWEVKAVDFDSLLAGRDSIPREELLARVKERSPVYTHKEVVLADELPTATRAADVLRRSRGGITQSEIITLPQYQDEASALGRGIGHGDPKYQDYGQGGAGYTEILLTQPGARANEYGNHWREAATNYTDAAEDAVAHARFDTHGDALRINELQSDLGNHNLKARAAAAREEAMGPEAGAIYRNKEGAEIPFPLEDSWSDLLIKRLALEAARKGHRAIEVASPRAIAGKVGGSIESYEHFYGKVVPGALERLGRKMGGLVDETPPSPPPSHADAIAEHHARLARIQTEAGELLGSLEGRGRPETIGGWTPPNPIGDWSELALSLGSPDLRHLSGDVPGHNLYNAMGHRLLAYGVDDPATIQSRIAPLMPRAMRLAEEHAATAQAISRLEALQAPTRPAPPRRYLMSDEMRRRLIQEGIGASLLAPVAASQMDSE